MMSRSEIKDWIVMSLSVGTMVLLFVITIGDFMNAMETNREPSKDVINLLSMAITGIVGIIAGFISGKNAADQAKQLELAAPKVEFHDKVVNDESTFSFRDAAKKIQQRPNKLIDWLRGKGYLCLNNMAKQQYIAQGLFATHSGVSDAGHHYTQCRVTGKGLSYFIEKLGGEKL